MRKFIVLGLVYSMLTSCSLFQVHKMEVEQGNYLTPSMVNRIHPGMTEGQVKAIMGEPILVNVTNTRLLSYVYTSQLGANPRTEKKVTLTFRNGVLVSIQREGV